MAEIRLVERVASFGLAKVYLDFIRLSQLSEKHLADPRCSHQDAQRGYSH
jgi:hypothetical protein